MAELKLLFRRPVAAVLTPEDALMGAIYRMYHPATAGPPASPEAIALLEQAARELKQAAS